MHKSVQVATLRIETLCLTGLLPVTGQAPRRSILPLSSGACAGDLRTLSCMKVTKDAAP